MPERKYTLTQKARAQRRAASAARAAASPRREFATVRIDKTVRDAAEAALRGGESLAAMVGAAVEREIRRRSGA